MVANVANRAAGSRSKEGLRGKQMRPSIICHMLSSVHGELEANSLD